MATKLEFTYPLFVPKQVLRSEDLNNIVHYLDEQNRLTRSSLAGMGILYGLDLEWIPAEEETPAKIRISKGIGLSSMGYLFDIGETEFMSYSETQVDLDHFLCEDDIELLRGDEPPITLWELSGQDGENPVGELLVDSSVNSDELVIMLFWDQSQEMKETCFSKPGEVAGETQIAIRIFAITPEDAIRITKFYGKDEEEKDVLPEIALPRFGYMKKDEIPADFQTLSEQSGDGIYLHAIEDFDTFFQIYNNNCALGIEDPAGVGDIIRAYDEVGSRFSELFFGEDTEPFQNLQDYLTRLLDQVSQGKYRIGMQYFYDYLKDLVLAYLEFVNSDFADTLWNNPDKCLFPYHNLLGLLKKNITTYDFEVTEDYRTHLIRPPVAGLVNDDLNHARDLFQRMMVLAGSEGEKLFKVPGLDLESGNHSLPEEIKITPSKGKLFPLSNRAIPYYYLEDDVVKTDGSIRTYWSYQAKSKKRQGLIPAYFPVPKQGVVETSNLNKKYLLRDMDAYDFFRIEGHLFDELDKVVENLQQQRQSLNLPFDIRCVELPHVKVTTNDFEDELCGKSEWSMIDLEIDFQKCRNDLLYYLQIMQDILTEKSDEGGSMTDPKWQTGRFSIEIPDDHPWVVLYKWLNETSDLNQFVKAYKTFRNYFYELFPPVAKNLSAEEKAILKRLGFSGKESPFESLKKPFDILVQNYKTRCKEIVTQLYFNYFAKAHPGMEHMAGVPKGGTFILVYTDTAANLQILTGAVSEKVLANEEMTEKEFQAFAKDEFWLVKKAKELKFPSSFFKQRVIADFALPYLCCSSTPSITYEIRKPAPAILLNPEWFCSGDERKYPIIGLPEGGEFVESPWLEEDNGKYYFVPGKNQDQYLFKEGEARVDISYIFNDQVAKKAVMVYHQPVPNYTYEETEIIDEGNPCELLGYTYTFINTSGYAYSSRMEVELKAGEQTETKDISDTMTLEVRYADYEGLLPVSIEPRITVYSKNKFCRDVYRGDTIIVDCPAVDIIPPEPLEPENPDHKDEFGNPIFFRANQSLLTFPIIVDRDGGIFTIKYDPEDGSGPVTLDMAFVDVYLQLSGPVQDNPCPSMLYHFTYDNNPEEDPNLPPPGDGKYIFTYEKTGCSDTMTVVLRSFSGREARRGAINTLGAENRLSTTKLFKTAQEFVDTETPKTEDLEKQLEGLVEQFQKSNANASAARKPQYQQLMQMGFQEFNDRIVVAHEKQLPQSTVNLMEKLFPLLKAEGMDPKDIWKSWKAPDSSVASIAELEQLYTKS